MLKWSDFKKVLMQLRKPEAKDIYDTIVIDTVSLAYDLCEKFILQRESVSSIKDIPFGSGYGMVANEFQEALREITMLGFGLILICHSKEVASGMTDSEGNPIMSIQPSLTKRPMEICNALCDIIGCINTEFEDGKPVRYLYTRQTPTIFAGSRYKYLSPRIKFGYQELVDAIAEAIDKSAKLDGATVVEHIDTVQVKDRPFNDTMAEAKELWSNYIAAAKTDEEKDQHLAFKKDIIKRIFGTEDFKLSGAVPSQQDLVELFIEEMKNL
jgi:hypothetical protein